MEVPGLMCPVLKLPARVAVCATRLVLEKVTSDPLAIVRVGGWKAKWLISTVEAPARLSRATCGGDFSPQADQRQREDHGGDRNRQLCQVLRELRAVVIN